MFGASPRWTAEACPHGRIPHEAGLREGYHVEPDVVRVRVSKKLGTMVGMTLMASNTADGKAVVVGIVPGSLLDEWNQGALSSQAVTIGDIVTEVNGLQENVAIMNELTKPGPMDIVFKRAANNTEEYRAEMSSFGVEIQQHIALKGHGPVTCKGLLYMPIMAARDAGADHCAICMEGVEPDERVMQLTCGHSFHGGCVTQWFFIGKRRVCPLCMREVA